jgi:hypothetical protein
MRWILPLLLVIFFGSGACFAQAGSSGEIRGTVTDSTGALIPSVTVTVKDVDKETTITYVTNSAGFYDTGSIPEDHYLITFTKEGFESYVRGPITLELATVTIDAKLPVGKISQEVVVNTDVAMLSTESGAQEGVLEADSMVQLPQVGGLNGGGADWENFIILLPGASGAPENSSNNLTAGMATSINGNLPFASMLQDGATTTLPMSQNSDVTIFETTAEVKVSATGFSAQYGVGDVVYNQITKSGGDKYHGSAYEYLQNNMFNSDPYEFSTTKTGIPPLHFNNFGGSVGGPILKHKAFFFFDYDRTINHGAASASSATVPTSAMESGDFTGMATLYDPTTQVIVNTGSCTYTGSQYPGGTLIVAAPCVQRTSFDAEYHNGNKIPTGMLDPVAQAIQKYFPAPTAGSGSLSSSGYYVNNFTYLAPSSNPYIKWFGRADYDFSPKNRLTLAETESNNPGEGVGFGTSYCPINCQSQDVSRDNASVSDVWTISSHVINEARLGFTDQLNYFSPQTIGQGFPAKLGLQFSQADNFPQVNIGNFSSLGTASNSVYKEMVFDPSDVATVIKGRHVLHFGGEFLINRADSTAWGNLVSANVTYNGTYTAAGGSNTNAYDGLNYADFLLGQTQGWSALVQPEFGGRWKTPQFFAQDDFKFKPNLTFNMGVRYEIMTGWSEVKGNMRDFDPAVSNFNVSSTAINGIAPGAPVQGGMWYASTAANGRTTLQRPRYNIVMPRVGFSWEAMHNTVIRGGIGIYASTWSEDTYGAGMGSAVEGNGNDSDTTNGICPVVQLSGTGKTPDTTDPGCGIGSLNGTSLLSNYVQSPTTAWAYNNQSVSYNQYNTPVPKNYQYTLAVQREFLTDFVGEVAYVGNHGTGINFPVDINQVPESALGPSDLASKPYPIFNQINGSTNNGISNYNSLQAQLTKRLTHGLQFSVNYTWSHFLDDIDASGWGSRMGWQNYQNAFDPKANYSNSNFDIRQMLKGEVVYQLPFGRGKQFLNDNLILDEVLGGWQLSGTFVDQGGNPIGLTTGNNNNSNNQSGGYTQEANLTGSYKTATGSLPYHSIGAWFNLGAFALPEPYTYGTFKRNQIYGPGLNVVNFSFGKSFDLWPEKVKFQIRGDATNVLNHPSYGQPSSPVAGGGGSSSISGLTVDGRVWQIVGRVSF